MTFRYLTVSILGFISALSLSGCWDEVVHVYDDGNTCVAEDSESETVDDNDSETSLPADSDTSADPINSVLPAEWQGFGTACQSDADCTGYPAENKRCIQNVMGIIAAPGGYCTACCSEPGKDKCGPGVDCVGVSGAYLVCIERCRSNADCRGDDFWECRDMYYISMDFPDDYCLPDEAHNQPDPDKPAPELQCPWPWS
jgi:hypothetical protein